MNYNNKFSKTSMHIFISPKISKKVSLWSRRRVTLVRNSKILGPKKFHKKSYFSIRVSLLLYSRNNKAILFLLLAGY